jgi:hypothetical protein
MQWRLVCKDRSFAAAAVPKILAKIKYLNKCGRYSLTETCVHCTVFGSAN